MPTHFAARVKQGCNDRCGRGDFPVDEKCLHRSANACPAHLGIQHNSPRHVWISALVQICMTDAVQMCQHWNPCLLLHQSDPPLATARNDDVDQPARLEHFANRCTTSHWHQYTSTNCPHT